MDYRYNYKFLSSWMEQNKKNRTDILEAIGTQDFRSAKDWIQGKRPLPLGMLLRICNTFQIPLEQFFFDYDQSPAQPIRKPQDDKDQTEPTGGYPKDEDRKNRQSINPKALYKQPSEMPAQYPLLIESKEDANKESDAAHNQVPTTVRNSALPEEDKVPLLSESVDVLKLKIKHQQEIMDIRKECYEHEEQMRKEYLNRIDKKGSKLYEIIDNLQKTVDKLTANEHNNQDGHDDQIVSSRLYR